MLLGAIVGIAVSICSVGAVLRNKVTAGGKSAEERAMWTTKVLREGRAAILLGRVRRANRSV
jgi:hypothetical protein